MGNFISKAWVEIADAEKRKEIHDKIYLLFKQSEDDTLFGYEECELKKCLSINNGVVRLNMWATLKLNNISYINCNHYANGDEDLAVKLFLELAKMRDDTNIGRWYSIRHKTYDGYGYDYVRSRVVNMADYIIGNHAANSGIWNNYSKLTPLELAEAVKSGVITKEQLTDN